MKKNIFRSLLCFGMLIGIEAIAIDKQVPDYSRNTSPQLTTMSKLVNKQNAIIRQQTTLINDLYSKISKLDNRVTAVEVKLEQRNE